MRGHSSSALLLFLAAACASAGSGGTETAVAPVTTSLVNTGGTMNISGAETYTAISTAVPVSQDSAYQLIRRVYRELEMPVTIENGSNRSVGNEVLRVRRRLAGMLMQNIVDCGDKMGLKNAETWDIEMNILSYATKNPEGGANVLTRIQALGHDPSVSGRDQIPCATTGDLEAKIGNLVKAKVAGK